MKIEISFTGWPLAGSRITLLVANAFLGNWKWLHAESAGNFFMEINDFVCKMSWIYFNYLYLKYGSQTIRIFANPSQTSKILVRFAWFRPVLEYTWHFRNRQKPYYYFHSNHEIAFGTILHLVPPPLRLLTRIGKFFMPDVPPPTLKIKSTPLLVCEVVS